MYGAQKSKILYTEVMYMKSDSTIYFERIHDLTIGDMEFIREHADIVGVKNVTFAECKGLTDEKVEIISEIIFNARDTLEYLNLGYNRFPFDLVKKIVDNLKWCTKLKRLFLDGNNLGYEGLIYIFRALRGLGLEEIHLTDVVTATEKNSSKSGGWVYHFGEFVSLTPSLRIADVNGNGGLETQEEKDAFVKYKREVIVRM